ncbi:MAG: hypothetical protein LBT00_16465 [Spirochaetaceae bacterium]|jgi:lipopolysaccharide biosynthesis glycosyltransferase|nr:hypothetical protein [Spirochaetaceae bacterium]
MQNTNQNNLAATAAEHTNTAVQATQNPLNDAPTPPETPPAEQQPASAPPVFSPELLAQMRRIDEETAAQIAALPLPGASARPAAPAGIYPSPDPRHLLPGAFWSPIGRQTPKEWHTAGFITRNSDVYETDPNGQSHAWHIREPLSMEIRLTSYTRESVDHYCVLALSILKHNRQHGVGFHLLTTPEIAQEFTTIQRLRLCIEMHGGAFHVTTREMIPNTDDDGAFFKNFFKTYHITDIPNAFYENKKPFLLLDDDILCRGSIKELLETELPEGYIAGVTDCAAQKKTYINAGVLLARPFSATYTEIMKVYLDSKLANDCQGTYNFFGEQTGLNGFFKDKKILLPYKYNFFPYMKGVADNNLFTKHDEPVLFHFLSNNKMWNADCRDGIEPYFTEWSEYYAELHPTPIHAAWGADCVEQLGYAITSYCSMQYYCPRKIIPHFLITFPAATLDEKCSKFREHVVEINTKIFDRWNPNIFTLAVFCKNIAPYFVEIPKEHNQRLIISDNDRMYRCDVSSLYDMDLKGSFYSAIDCGFPGGSVQWKRNAGIRHHCGSLICADISAIKRAVPLEVLSANAKKISRNPQMTNPDEALWGVTFGNNFSGCDKKWNGCQLDNTNPTVHFQIGNKPWNKDIYGINREPIQKFGDQKVYVNVNDLSKYYIEWIRFYEMFERGEEPKYSGRAKENNVLISLLGLTIPREGKEYRCNKSFVLANRFFIEEGKAFYPPSYEQSRIEQMGLAMPSILPP